MEYFEELALGPLCPIATPRWKRDIDDVICIIKIDQLDILFNHIGQMDAHIKFTLESLDSKGSIPFLDLKCSSNSNNTIYTTVYRKPAHRDRYLDWNANHPTSAKRSVTQTLTHRATMVCSISEFLAKEMDYLHRLLHRNNYPDWFLKNHNTRPQVDQSTIQETPKEVFALVLFIQGLSQEFRRIFKNTKVQIIFKGCNTLKSLLMYPKGNIPPQLHQDVIYQWTCPEENNHILKSPADVKRIGSKNIIFQPLVPFTNTVPPTTIPKQISYNLRSLIRTASKFLEKPEKLSM